VSESPRRRNLEEVSDSENSAAVRAFMVLLPFYLQLLLVFLFHLSKRKTEAEGKKGTIKRQDGTETRANKR